MDILKTVTLSNPPKVFKSIRVRKIFYDTDSSREVTGYLNYVRSYYDRYVYQSGDELDHRIREKAQATFVEAVPVINSLLVLDGQLEDYIQRTRGNTIQKVVLILSPEIPFHEVPNLVGKSFTQYKFPLKLNLQTTWQKTPSDKEDSFIEYLDIPINYEELDKLAKTIEQV